jgi:hypothetical protein
MTIGGLINCSKKPSYDFQVTGQQIHQMAKDGKLIRRGQIVELPPPVELQAGPRVKGGDRAATQNFRWHGLYCRKSHLTGNGNPVGVQMEFFMLSGSKRELPNGRNMPDAIIARPGLRRRRISMVVSGSGRLRKLPAGFSDSAKPPDAFAYFSDRLLARTREKTWQKSGGHAKAVAPNVSSPAPDWWIIGCPGLRRTEPSVPTSRRK